MCEPWPNASRPRRSASYASSEKSGPRTSLPGPSSAATPSTPESISATSMPAPVGPPCAPAAARIRSIEARARAGPSSGAGSTGATGSATASWSAPTESSPLATGSGASEEPAAASSAASAMTSRATSSAGSSVGISSGGGSIACAAGCSSTGVAVDSVSATSRATVRTEPDRRSRAIDAAGTRAVKPSTIGSRSPTSPPSRRTSRSTARALPGSTPTTTRTRSGAACAISAPTSESMSRSPRSGRMADRGMPPVSAPRAKPLLEHRSRPAGPGLSCAPACDGTLESRRAGQSSSVARRFSSAAARASRIGPSSNRSTSSAMKPSITSRVDVFLSSPRERR